jgi:hypothetical protein
MGIKMEKKREVQVQDFLGAKFGMLTVVEFVGTTPKNHRVWKALCDCGNETVVKTHELNKGDTRSCGCLHKAALVNRNKQSTDPWRKAHQREYNSYISARRRCMEPTDKDYYRYGAVGITFYEPWAESFRAFVDYMGARPDGHTLDRIDRNGGYEPGNVRWATPKLQAENRRSTVWVEADGQSRSMLDTAKYFGVTDGAIRTQLKSKGTLDGYNPRRRGQKENQSDSDRERGLLGNACQ